MRNEALWFDSAITTKLCTCTAIAKMHPKAVDRFFEKYLDLYDDMVHVIEEAPEPPRRNPR